MDTTNLWRVCSSCKAQIHFEDTYFACSVSTCNRQRTGLFFCSVSCWEVHLPGVRHREAYAIEKRAPSRAEWQRQGAAPSDRSRRVVPSPAAPAASGSPPREILVVASKMKKYIKAVSGMSTSDGVMDPLSDHLRRICDRAIRNAGEEGRRTVLDRDIPSS